MILECNGVAEPMHIGNLMDENVLTAYVKDRLEIVARMNFETLLCFKPEARIETPENELPPLKIPEELQKKKEQREEPIETEEPEQASVPKVIGRNGKPVINDVLLERLYFKEGKTGLQIVKETGLSESAVFNHLAKLRAAKEQAAKECVRQS